MKPVPPAGMLTEAGTGRFAELLVRVACSPPAGACAERYPTHEAVWSGISLAGVQVRVAIEYVAVAVTIREAALDTSPEAAVMVSACGTIVVEAVTWKEEEVRSQGIVIALGCVNPGAVTPIFTGTPAMDAGAVIVTVQVDVAPKAILVGPQVNDFSD